jgi:hypothetical protein
MDYKTEIVISLPRQKVADIFANPKNQRKWQPGLRSLTLLDGEPGKPGARSRWVLEMGGRPVEMTETVLSRVLPAEYSLMYETPAILNTVTYHFIEIDEGQTRLVAETRFYFRGLFNLTQLLLRGAFTRQTMDALIAFKQFAEEVATAR